MSHIGDIHDLGQNTLITGARFHGKVVVHIPKGKLESRGVQFPGGCRAYPAGGARNQSNIQFILAHLFSWNLPSGCPEHPEGANRNAA
ncbi:hypothetical protein D3C72_2273350 [compost metagenome]